MNAIWLLLPLLAVRFGLMGLLDKTALKRAAYFPPLVGNEKAAYIVYQVTNLFLFVYLLFLKIGTESPMLWIGLTVYGTGIVVCTASVYSFARPDQSGINRTGVYRVSRNPMYIGYFLYFLGCALLTRSAVLLTALIMFQAASQWIILSEERWCLQQFGEEYARYREKVRRYL